MCRSRPCATQGDRNQCGRSHIRARFPEAAGRRLFRRIVRRRDQLQGPHLRLHRSANTRLFEFDQNGNFLKEIGKGYYGFEFAHSVRVDPQDNIWTVDEGTNMVTKFSPEGKVLMVLGHRPPAVDGVVATPQRARTAGAKIHPLPAHRRRLGPAGQHFRL